MIQRAILLTGLVAASVLSAQARASGMAQAHVVILRRDTWRGMQGPMQGPTALGNVTLRGVVEGIDGATVRLRMGFGTLRVELGDAVRAEALRAGEAVELKADKITAGGAQRLLATEVTHLG